MFHFSEFLPKNETIVALLRASQRRQGSRLFVSAIQVWQRQFYENEKCNFLHFIK